MLAGLLALAGPVASASSGGVAAATDRGALDDAVSPWRAAVGARSPVAPVA